MHRDTCDRKSTHSLPFALETSALPNAVPKSRLCKCPRYIGLQRCSHPPTWGGPARDYHFTRTRLSDTIYCEFIAACENPGPHPISEPIIQTIKGRMKSMCFGIKSSGKCRSWPVGASPPGDHDGLVTKRALDRVGVLAKLGPADQKHRAFIMPTPRGDEVSDANASFNATFPSCRDIPIPRSARSVGLMIATMVQKMLNNMYFAESGALERC